MEDRANFNQEICFRFGFSSITKLAISIYRISISEGQESPINILKETLSKILLKYQIVIDNKDVLRISRSINRVLVNLGEVLQY